LDLERWLLKLLCGFHFVFGKAKSSGWTVPREWLDILFHGRPFPPRCGLFVERTPGVARELGAKMSVLPVIAAGKLVGVDVTLSGLRLVLLMDASEPVDATRVQYGDMMHRPDGIVLWGPGTTAAIMLHWPGPPHNSRLVYLDCSLAKWQASTS
jgi:hypothetical protein